MCSCIIHNDFKDENISGVFKVLFEFAESGKVWTKVDFRHLKFASNGISEKISLIVVTFFLIACDLVFTVIKVTSTQPNSHVGKFNAWTVIELLNTGIFISTLAIHIHIMTKTEKVKTIRFLSIQLRLILSWLSSSDMIFSDLFFCFYKDRSTILFWRW